MTGLGQQLVSDRLITPKGGILGIAGTALKTFNAW